MARTRASAAPGAAERRRAARQRVFNDEALLERILSHGHLRAKDVAAASLVRFPCITASYRLLGSRLCAQVSRSWSRIAAGDAVWRSVWLREARSLHHLESRIAAPVGPGFRAAVAQLRAAALVAYEPDWELADYSAAIDVTWRGQPLFSAHAPMTQLHFDDGGEAALQFSNMVHANESFAPLCLRTLQRAVALSDAEQRAAALSTARSHLALRLLVCRSDGAMACLADRDSNVDIFHERDATSVPSRIVSLNFTWDDYGPFYGTDEDGASLAFAVTWGVQLAALDDEEDPDEHQAPFSSCALLMAPDEGVEVDLSPELISSGLSMLRYISPAESIARAASASARQASAGVELASSEDDGDDNDE